MVTETNNLLSSLIDLVPVIGGAIIGILGGLVGTKYAHQLASKDSYKNLLRNKLEELVTTTFEIDVWVRKQEKHHLFGDIESVEQSPIAKIEALANLYFPELKDEVDEFSLAEMNYRNWLLEGSRLKGNQI